MIVKLNLRYKEMFTSMMRTGTMTANRVVSRSRTKLNTMWFSTSNATWQVSTVGSHMPESLATITLKNTVPCLKIRCFEKVANYSWPCLQRSTGTSGSSAPPTLWDSTESSCTEKVQSLTQ